MELDQLNSFITVLLDRAVGAHRDLLAGKITSDQFGRHLALIADGATQEIALSHRDIRRIFWDEQTGTVFWKEEDEIAFAPMNNDSTCDLDASGAVEHWEEPADEERVKARLK